MQLLNSNIPQGARTTKYSNKKAQDLLNLVLFCCVAFSYYKDGRGDGVRTHDLSVPNAARYQLRYASPFFTLFVRFPLFSKDIVLKTISPEYYAKVFSAGQIRYCSNAFYYIRQK